VKLPLSQRDEVPLIADKNKIVWVVGYRIDERVKITKNTKTVLEIKIE
jgi:tRNA(Ile)-lysidine synthase